jgi:hypothetical protein
MDDRVTYPRGLRVQSSGGTEVIVDRVAPYFQRSDLKFCSHFQAPPRKDILGEPAVLQGKNWIYFADPVFTDYRQSANLAVSITFAAAMKTLLGKPRTGWGLKSTVRVYPLRRGTDLHLTLLHYLPERKAVGADIVSERLGFGGQTLRLPDQIKSVSFEASGEIVDVKDGCLPLPCAEGRLLLRIPGFFD